MMLCLIKHIQLRIYPGMITLEFVAIYTANNCASAKSGVGCGTPT